MATRARIGIERTDGSILTSYVHWDGYPGGLGYNLVTNWTDYDKVLEAIQLGDASTWGTEIGVKHPFSVYEQDNKGMDPKEAHKRYNEQYGDMNTYYQRDRGEIGAFPMDFKDAYMYRVNGSMVGEEYLYLFASPPAFEAGVGCQWSYLDTGYGVDHRTWELLHMRACKDHHQMMKRAEELTKRGEFVG